MKDFGVRDVQEFVLFPLVFDKNIPKFKSVFPIKIGEGGLYDFESLPQEKLMDSSIWGSASFSFSGRDELTETGATRTDSYSSYPMSMWYTWTGLWE